MIEFSDFEKIDIRVGKVIEMQDFPEGRYSTHILKIDFGEEIGVKTSLAKLAPHYKTPELVGQLVLGVVNFKPRQIGKYMSEVLTLGFADGDNNVVLVRPDRAVPLGGKLH